MRIGPRDSPRPEPGDEPPEPRTPRPVPYPGDVHVAGSPSADTAEPPDDPGATGDPGTTRDLGNAGNTGNPGYPGNNDPAPADWVPVQGTPRPEEPIVAEDRREQRERELAELYERRRRELRRQREARDRREPEHPESAPEPERPAASPPPPPPAVTVPDLSAWSVPERPAAVGPMDDPERRRTLVDAFVAEFVASATWRATLAVLEGAFPGLGMAATLSRRTDELWRTIHTLEEVGSAGLGVPVWLDGGGLVFDLSARLRARRHGGGPQQGVRPRASWPYAGAFVVDTLDPLRYHRAVGGPAAPAAPLREGAPVAPPPGEEDDSGVVIVADLTLAGVRVLDAAALWRYAGRVVVATLHDPVRPETRAVARRALRALRRVVFVDPYLGLGMCLWIDITRTPRCLLVFAVDPDDERTPRFVRP
ncbi:hypothetical protein [Actinomadura sp. 9N407]|uniref:hypothetical protein n=1 Tax=Actinomadura sp. 9N407 TaxID=3375154 RepID=UPI003796E0FC